MKKRKNQKIRRKPHGEEGVFTKDGVLRVVALHPTKGLRETNGEYGREMFQAARDNQEQVKIQRGNTVKTFNPVKSNAPTVYHNKSG